MRYIGFLSVMFGVCVVGTSVAQPPLEEAPTSVSLKQRPIGSERSDQERQKRIEEHNERIRKIIEQNNARRAQQTREKLAERRNIQPGWMVRVAEGLVGPEKDRLVRELASDGYSPLVIPAEPPSLDSKIAAPELHDVLLHFGDNKASAMAAERKLRDLGYQFNSVRFGRVVEQISTSEVADADGTATENLTSATLVK